MKAHFDIAIVGAGPAALAAIAAISRYASVSRRVVVIDEAAQPGGRVWAGAMSAPSAEAQHMLRPISTSTFLKIQWWPSSRVVSANDRELLIEDETSARIVSFGKLILATGARELFLPFRGWALPGVMGVGALQLMAKSGMRLDGKRVVLAGSGPLLLAAAASLRATGATVVRISEAQPASRLRAFAKTLLRFPDRLLQALQLRGKTLSTPYRFGETIRVATGADWVASVTVRRADGTDIDVPCDYLGVAYGLIPNVELGALIGCRLDERSGSHSHISVDDECRTSVPNVYAIGEANGIGGKQKALADGHLVGSLLAHASAQVIAHATRARIRERDYASALARAFDCRTLDVTAALDDATLVCRCENVSWQAIKQHDNWRDYRLMERCGMGFCQGRVCEGALVLLTGTCRNDWRAPVFPCRVETLARL